MAATIALTGGGVAMIGGVRVSARSPWSPAFLGVAALIGWAISALRHASVVCDLHDLSDNLERRARALSLALAVVAALAAAGLGSASAAGADASGYLSEARLLASGALTHRETLASIATWSDGPASLAPLGWLATARGVQVPTYPIGLPLLMAPLHAVGGADLAFLVIPATLAVAIIAIAAIAHATAGPVAGLIAAAWLAGSPTWQFHALQPMSDVPAAAGWLLCWALLIASPSRWPVVRVAVCAGVAAAVAVLIRPNLAPLAAIPACYVLLGGDGATRHARGERWRRAIAFAAPVAVAGTAVAAAQWYWFGSPLRSGYGTAAEIYSAANVAPNLRLYAEWFVGVEQPLLLTAPLAVWLVRGRVFVWLFGFALAVVAAYLVYAVFEVWTYLRFLLPAIGIAIAASACVAAKMIARLPKPLRVAAFVVVLVTLVAGGARSAAAHGVFDIAARQARASLAGRYLAAQVGQPALIVSGEQSGAMRYYTDGAILRWDVLTPDAWRTALAQVQRLGSDVWIVLDEWEEPLFRAKFIGTPLGDLAWPAAADAGTLVRTRVWRAADAARFERGEVMRTERLRD